MKIMENGVIRDMTAEEEATFIREHENMPKPGTEQPEPTAEEILDIILGGAE